MAKFCKIDPRVWTDEKFVRLGDDGKQLWLFLLTCPMQRALPGVVHLGKAALAEYLHWPAKRLDKAFEELLAKGFRIRFDFACKLIWLENSVKYQSPENPNAVKAWAKHWGDLPRVEWLHDLWSALRDSIRFTDLFAQLFKEPLREPMGELLSDGLLSGALAGALASAGAGALDPVSPGRTQTVQATAQALELWAEQDKLRQQAIPGCRPLKPSKGQLARVEDAIREHGVDDCRHVLAVYAAEAKLNPDAAKWFNGVSNWRTDNINRARGRVVPTAKNSTRDIRIGSAPPNDFAGIAPGEHAL